MKTLGMTSSTQRLEDGSHEHVYQARESDTHRSIFQRRVRCTHIGNAAHDPAEAVDVWQTMREEARHLGYGVAF